MVTRGYKCRSAKSVSSLKRRQAVLLPPLPKGCKIGIGSFFNLKLKQYMTRNHIAKPVFLDGREAFQKKFSFKMGTLEKKAMEKAVSHFLYMRTESVDLGEVKRKIMYFQVDVFYYVYDKIDFDLFQLGMHYQNELSTLIENETH